MPQPDQPDEALARLFEQLRADTLAQVRPPGASQARWAARRRQYRRRRVLATAAAVLGMVFAGALGTGAAQLVLSDRTERVTHAAADASASSDTATPAPQPAPSPTASPGAGGPSPGGTAATRRGTRSPSPAASASATYQPTRCHTDELSAGLESPADAPPSGVAYADLTLTNRASHGCRMFGYPGMQLLDGSGAPLPTNVVRDTSVGPALFTLRPGGTARARLSWSVAPDADETAPCTPDARALWVTPPDEFTQLTVQVTINVCHHGEILTGPTHG